MAALQSIGFPAVAANSAIAAAVNTGRSRITRGLVGLGSVRLPTKVLEALTDAPVRTAGASMP